MPELDAAKALDLGVVPTGRCLGAEPPVLVSERSVSCGCQGVSACLAIGRISYPIRRASASICCKVGTPDGSEGLRLVHGGRSPTANMASI